jgi:hypothetical protein
MMNYRTMCEDAPCCGCCGQDRFEPDYGDESFDWMSPVYDPIEDEQDEEDHGHQCDEMGEEDRYLDASWEDRFECDYGDY